MSAAPVRRAARLRSALADSRTLRRWQSTRVAAWSGVLTACLLLGLGAVLARVAQLKVAPDPRLAASLDRKVSVRPEPARRGTLLDRNGRALATTTDGYRVYVDPEDALRTGDVTLSELAGRLALVLGVDPVTIDRPLQERVTEIPETRFVPVTGVVGPVVAARVRAARGDLPGVGLEPRPIRHAHAAGLAAPLVGFVNFDHEGRGGAEGRFDARLEPTAGRLRYHRDAQRNALWIEPGDYEPGQDGRAVRLSLDLEIQRYAQRRLEAQVEAYNANGGRIVVLDPATGEILALHDLVRPRDPERDQLPAEIAALPAALRPVRCATDPYEPGSTFKPFVWAVATELGIADPAEELDMPLGDPGWRVPYGRRWVRDSWYYGKQTWRFVLVKSLNSGMAMIAERMRRDQMRSVLERFGFGERTRAGVPGETRGILPPADEPDRRERWTRTSLAFGHGLSVSALQLARAFSVFARDDGTLPELRLLAVDDANRDLLLSRRAISPELAREVRAILHDVTLEGTGRPAASSRYRTFGKSGTAQLPNARAGGYFEDRYVSSYIAGAPLEQPRLVVLCVIDDPDRSLGPHGGGRCAGPVVRDVIDAALTYLGVPPDQPGHPDAVPSTAPAPAGPLASNAD